LGAAPAALVHLNAIDVEAAAGELAAQRHRMCHQHALEGSTAAFGHSGALASVRFPEVHDGYDRLGMVYEARGQNRQAADCYRKVIEFVLARPQQYDPEFVDVFRELVAKLEPSE
jgi:hypothetical protein